MRVVALISGGKDSCYNMMQCVSEGHEVVALANLKPKDKDELDSYMYQTVGHHAIDLYAEATGLPLYRRTIEGGSVSLGRDYSTTKEDEVEDLYALLQDVVREQKVEGVSVGAILSDYQRVRVEHVCRRLGLMVLGFLWRRDQVELLDEMIQCKIHAILIKVAALGLSPGKHLGKTLQDIQPHMIAMKEKFGLNVCGEGGEYETFTLDCPMFKKKIVIDECETVLHSDDAFAPVGYINFKKMHLEDKPPTSQSVKNIIDLLPMKRSSTLHSDLLNESDGASSYSSYTNVDVCRKCVQNRITGMKLKKAKGSNEYLFVSGFVALRNDKLSMEESTQLALQSLINKLHDDGYQMSDIVCVYLYVENLEQYSQINRIYNNFFDLNPPVRLCVQVDLPDNVIAVLDFIACKTNNRTTMHVQGLSHWAPANIGPYSQAVKINEHIFVAGMLGMVPATLAVVKGGCVVESRLSLQHIRKVLQAMHPQCELKDLVLVLCFVTKQQFLSVAAQEWKRALHAYEDKEFGAEYDGGLGADPIVQYQVVAALPKGAAVEWKVVAAVDCGQRTGGGHQKRYEGYMTEATFISQPDLHKLLSFRVLLELERVEVVKEGPMIRDYLQAVLTAATECCSRFHYTHKSLLRVFFRQDVFQLQSLQTNFEEMCFEHDFGCASFIPVRIFDSNNCVLTVTSVIL